MHIPLLLTLVRLIVAPLFLPILLVAFLPSNVFFINILLAAAFFVFSITDFFDGYLARRYQLETMWGRLLDPLADKFLVFSTLIALVVVHKIYFLWVIIIIGREFFVMSLREIALSHNFSVPVSYLGKIKTAVQMMLIFFIILNPYQHYGLADGWNRIELALLILALFFTFISAWDYYRRFARACC
ncbi:MAG: CDP-diacylglycerol--glycerol-3-phosphate 3-phosphatidyltransferase [Candidatus Babeliaceae bacterium]|jgi:CDP-diacylglycerol--glycerol-3-phosphate 3-phosphatidyltransferase